MFRLHRPGRPSIHGPHKRACSLLSWKRISDRLGFAVPRAGRPATRLHLQLARSLLDLVAPNPRERETDRHRHGTGTGTGTETETDTARDRERQRRRNTHTHTHNEFFCAICRAQNTPGNLKSNAILRVICGASLHLSAVFAIPRRSPGSRRPAAGPLNSR